MFVFLFSIFIVIFGLYVAVQTFHDQDLGPNQRFYLAMSDLILIMAYLVVTFSKSPTLVLIFEIVGGVIFVATLPLLFRTMKKTHRERKVLKRVQFIVMMYTALHLNQIGEVRYGDDTVDQIKQFLGKVSSKHRKQAKYFAKKGMKSLPSHEMPLIKRIYSQPNLISHLIDTYWRYYDD